MGMTPSLASLEEQREHVLEQMRSIDRLYRGTLSRHFLRRKRGPKNVVHGPYFVLQGSLAGRKFSRHVPAQEAAAVGEYVDNYKRFQELAERFVTLTEQITLLAERQESKKNSRRRNSTRNASERPRHS